MLRSGSSERQGRRGGGGGGRIIARLANHGMVSIGDVDFTCGENRRRKLVGDFDGRF
jgi:hypothetical protein